MNKFLLLFLSMITVACFSCQENNVNSASFAEQSKNDKALINTHLVEKGIQADSTGSGLRYVISNLGNNDNNKPTAKSTVKVRYKGYFLNGEVFDQTQGDDIAEFPVSNLVKGFSEALCLLNKNGKGTFFMPSGLAYGTRGSRRIPPNTPLIFDIELIDFN